MDWLLCKKRNRILRHNRSRLLDYLNKTEILNTPAGGKYLNTFVCYHHQLEYNIYVTQ